MTIHRKRQSSVPSLEVKTLVSILSLFLSTSCNPAQVDLFYDMKFPPTDSVEVFGDITTIPWEYFKIGYVEVTGAERTSNQQLLEDLKNAAQKVGAHALIDVYFSSSPRHETDLSSSSPAVAKGAMIRYKVRNDGEFIRKPPTHH